MPVINTNLSVPPADPVEAENYPALFDLRDELRTRLDACNDFSEGEFKYWDDTVKHHPRPNERERFEQPLGPKVPINNDTIQHSRRKWLTRILWARQGAETLMTKPVD